MGRLKVLAFALALSSAVPSAAEPSSSSGPNALPLTAGIAGDAPLHLNHQGFSMPVIDYVEPTGTLQRRRGIIAGKTVAPDTLVGVGVFGSAPKVPRVVTEPPALNALRRPRRSAAIGLSMKF